MRGFKFSVFFIQEDSFHRISGIPFLKIDGFCLEFSGRISFVLGSGFGFIEWDFFFKVLLCLTGF